MKLRTLTQHLRTATDRGLQAIGRREQRERCDELGHRAVRVRSRKHALPAIVLGVSLDAAIGLKSSKNKQVSCQESSGALVEA
jgi:hypothetical protein